MSKIGVIMIDNADDLRDKANEFKIGLKKQYVTKVYRFLLSSYASTFSRLEPSGNLT